MSEPTPQLSTSALTSAAGNEADEVFQSSLATRPPLQEWTEETFEIFRSSIKEKCPDAIWDEKSEWTRRLVNEILVQQEGWEFARLKTCSNADYFSLPIHIINLLNMVYHAGLLEAAQARVADGKVAEALELEPLLGDKIGYPIFRTDYSDDALYALYEKYWHQFLESNFYVLGVLDPDDVMWAWIDDKDALDGSSPLQVSKLFRTLSEQTGCAFENSALWNCIIVDRGAIESMLRVYGPPTIEIFRLSSGPREKATIKERPFVPYFTVADTAWEEEVQDEKDGEYYGYYLCALGGIFGLYELEQGQSPDEFAPKRGEIYGGDIFTVFEAPKIPL